MSTLTLAPPRPGDVGGEPTLDEEIIGVWEGLAAHHPAACPLCGGEMAPLYGAQVQRDRSGAVDVRENGHRPSLTPEGGRCRDCETVLS